ncbi:hypothetical protein CIG19_15230 [Enterobacterales bacterium CwR94]|nr:hypothetical protein CIG19_15230 [Enterobacterales bacterium CwR94]
MMYVLYQSFGLFVKNDKHRETRNNSGFSFHQVFAKHCYDSVSDIVDTNGVFSKEQRREIFARYEQLYNALMHIPVFSRLDNSQIARRYLQEAIPPVIALEIYKTLQPNDETHFYFHIHQFLNSRHCPSVESGSECVYAGVRDYLREYISTLGFSYKAHLSSVFSHIANIRKGNGQKNETIKQKIILSRTEYIESSISGKDVTANNARLVAVERAYLSLNALLELEKYTALVVSLSGIYRKMTEHGIFCNSINRILHHYIYSEQYDETLLYSITWSWNRKTTPPISVTLKEEPYRYIIELRNIVFNTNQSGSYSGWDFIKMSACLKSSNHSDVVKPYAKLMALICLLSREELTGAWTLVNDIDIEELPIGFLPAAFSVIKLALKVKLERNKIRDGVLLSMINSILANQGVLTDYRAVTQQGIVSPMASSANNLVIMRAVKMYNVMIRKISYLHEVDPFGIYPHAISGLLKKFDDILGKVNRYIKEKECCNDNKILSDLIWADKILTVEELSGSLIGILSESTLYNCLLSIDDLIYYLRCPGEDISNIILLAGISRDARYMREQFCEILQLLCQPCHTG